MKNYKLRIRSCCNLVGMRLWSLRFDLFYWIWASSALGDKDELVTFWGQKVSGQGHKFSGKGIPMDGLPSKTVKFYLLLVCVCVSLFVSCLSLIVIVQSDE